MLTRGILFWYQWCRSRSTSVRQAGLPSYGNSMKKHMIIWGVVSVILAAGYALYEFYSSAKEDCYKQPYVSSTFCAIERK